MRWPMRWLVGLPNRDFGFSENMCPTGNVVVRVSETTVKKRICTNISEFVSSRGVRTTIERSSSLAQIKNGKTGLRLLEVIETVV